MDFGSMLGESFAYAKDAVFGKWKEWLLLIIATVLLTIPLMGYTLQVFRGEKPAPEVTGWARSSSTVSSTSSSPLSGPSPAIIVLLDPWRGNRCCIRRER